ncbi:MAG TPA: hypothetical protein VNL92_01360 [Dehalococcoidia bacterium]|nr:hypothetical protein [Dehalococcoidia bacterium]
MLAGEDFDVADGEAAPEDLVVSIATDVPVHASLTGGRADDILLTPYIKVVSMIGPEVAAEVVDAVGKLRGLREAALPYLRRGVDRYLEGDLPGAIDAAAAAFEDRPAEIKLEAATLLRAFLEDLYQPLGGADAIDAAIAETEAIIRAAKARDATATAALLTALESGPLQEHRRRVLDTALRVLADVDALTSALWSALLETRLPAEELLALRVMRDDFDVLKSRYQDAFELGSMTLGMIAPFANITLRGDVRSFADGQRRSLKDALGARAAVREGWLVDLPAAKVLFDAVSRRTRNDIGHRLVRYDFNSGDLVYDDGAHETYLDFVVDYLNAARLSRYLADIVLRLP